VISGRSGERAVPVTGVAPWPGLFHVPGLWTFLSFLASVTFLMIYSSEGPQTLDFETSMDELLIRYQEFIRAVCSAMVAMLPAAGAWAAGYPLTQVVSLPDGRRLEYAEYGHSTGSRRSPHRNLP
jgi:hypothetical protein